MIKNTDTNPSVCFEFYKDKDIAKKNKRNFYEGFYKVYSNLIESTKQGNYLYQKALENKMKNKVNLKFNIQEDVNELIKYSYKS